MSTKIYTAYRLKSSKDLWPWIHKTRIRGEKEVKKVLTRVLTVMMGEVDPNSQRYQDLVKEGASDFSARMTLASRQVRKEYREQLTSSERDFYDFSVSLSLRELNGRIYIIPQCDMMMRDTLNFLKRDPMLEDFAYWNNADQPKHISKRAWDARGKIWDALDDMGPQRRWSNCLVLEICSWDKFMYVDPYMDMLRSRQKSNKITPA